MPKKKRSPKHKNRIVEGYGRQPEVANDEEPELTVEDLEAIAAASDEDRIGVTDGEDDELEPPDPETEGYNDW